ncbi:MAG: hypothetical protein CMM61_07355, partial [Rhodospirillaceae bacterium]|nr:hypothetical protein [Rhodospirillaceae bacterium]
NHENLMYCQPEAEPKAMAWFCYMPIAANRGDGVRHIIRINANYPRKHIAPDLISTGSRKRYGPDRHRP